MLGVGWGAANGIRVEVEPQPSTASPGQMPSMQLTLLQTGEGDVLGWRGCFRSIYVRCIFISPRMRPAFPSRQMLSQWHPIHNGPNFQKIQNKYEIRTYKNNKIQTPVHTTKELTFQKHHYFLEECICCGISFARNFPSILVFKISKFLKFKIDENNKI